MSERENPFTKKAAAEPVPPWLGRGPEAQKGAENQPKPTTRKRNPPGRPPNVPSFESVLTAVERGDYDEYIGELQDAIKARNVARQEDVLRLVTEVFGDDATIEFTKGSDDSGGFTRSSIGIHQAQAEPSPFESTEPDETITEPQEDMEEGSPTPDPLAHLDQVEAKMEAEAAGGAVEEPQTTTTPPYIPPEQRGAIISGMHSSDMGE